MLLSKFSAIKISGVSVATPTGKIEVESYNDVFGEDVVSKFIKMTGVKSIYRAVANQTASDLGFAAATNLLEKQDIDKEDIQVLIFVSQKTDFRVPSTAFHLHKKLDLPDNCLCFDINLACSGYIYGLQTVFSLLNSAGGHKKALLITGDTSIKSLAPQDRSMSMLFGDSGSASLVEKTLSVDKISRFCFKSDGKRFKSIITPAGAYRNIGSPTKRVQWSDEIFRSDYDTHMKGMDVFGFSITDVPKLMKDFLKELNKSEKDYDCFALHQANSYILKHISRKVKIPAEKIPIALDRYGNNSSNSIPLVLADTYGRKEGEKDIKIFMSGFGAGLSWACADLSIIPNAIHPIIKTDLTYSN
jgi:3-oxoacyl-[acyl-carrier-protein] synthase-3